MSLVNLASARSLTQTVASGGTNVKAFGYDGYDKKKSGVIRDWVDVAKEYANGIENLLGTRPPMYKIGQIDAVSSQDVSNVFGETAGAWVNKLAGGVTSTVARAVSAFDSNTQEGVIIDGFDTFDGDISVDMPSNPMLYRSNILDQRIRTPNTVTIKVYVSNYLTDDIIDSAINFVASQDPTGILGSLSTAYAYGGNTRAQRALYKLRSIQETGKPFTVYTPHGVYENMLIKQIKPTTGASSIDMLEATITFQEVLFYYTESSLATTQMPSRTNIAETSTIYGKIKNKFGWK